MTTAKGNEMLMPEKLKKGDTVRVIAPSRSLAIISEDVRKIATARFTELGLKVTFSKNCEVIDEFASSSIEERITDLHEAFLDNEVKAIFTVIGGHNSNQLLKYIDYSIIKANPKILCGYSDTTALANAIYSQTGLVTYSGPAYSTLGMKQGIEFSLEYLQKCLFSDTPYNIGSPELWSDDLWFLDQENRTFIENDGIKVLNEGRATGTLIGGNLCTFNLLQGTEFMPTLTDSVLFIEDDELTFAENFDRDLQSLIHQPQFEQVTAIVIGKFQNKSNISEDTLKTIISKKKELASIPILYNVSFGHTTPHICFPLGGKVEIDTESENKILITAH